MKLDERILRDFKIGVFVGVRKSKPGMHTAFFIDGKAAGSRDVSVLLGALRAVPAQVRRAYQDLQQSSAKEKKKRRKKSASS